MTEYKHKVLLLPTTDFTAKSFYETYRLVLDKVDFTIILEGPNIQSEESYPDFITLKMKSYRVKRNLAGLRFFFPILLRVEVSRILRKHEYNSIIVSNECGLHQSIFVKKAQKRGIRCISHQVSSGIVNNDVLKKKLSLAKRIILNLYGSRQCKGYGYYSDEVWLMGEAWRNILQRDTFDIMPNGYYQNLVSSFRANSSAFTRWDKSQRNIVFFGGPLSEIELTTREQHLHILQSLESFALTNKELENTKFFYKPHPQEALVWSDQKIFQFVNIVDCSPEEALFNTDIGLSVSSSMSLQSRLLGKRSIGFHPYGLSEAITGGSKHFFDKIFKDIKELTADDLLHCSTNNSKELNDVVNMNIDLRSKLLLKL